jgi:site-specific recombinase XerD
MKPAAVLAAAEPGMEEYVSSIGTNNPRSIEVYLEMFGHVVRQARELGLPSLKEMDVKSMTRLVAELRKSPSGGQYLRRLRSFYRFYDRGDLLRVIPKVRSTETKIGPEDIISVAELSRLLAAARSLRDRALLVTLFESGGRISSLLAIDIENLTRHQNGANQGRPWFEAWSGTQKTKGEEHYIYWRQPASVQVIDEWVAAYPSDVVKSGRHPLIPSFSPAGNGRLTMKAVNRLLKAVAREAGVDKDLHSHVFRHSAATFLLQQGMPEAIIKRALGLKPNSKMLERYLHLTQRDVRAAFGLESDEREVQEIAMPVTVVPPMAELPFNRDAAKEIAELHEQVHALFAEMKKMAIKDALRDAEKASKGDQ